MSTPFLIGEEKISLSKFFSFLITYKSVSLSIWENSSLLPFTPLPNTYIICNIFMRKFFMYSKVPFPPHHILGLCSLTMFSYYVLVLCPYTISLYHISMPYPYTMSLCHVIVLWLYTMSLPVPITSSLPIFPSIGPLCDGEKISHYIFILTFNSSLFSPYGRMCQRTRERAAGKWTDGSGEIWRFFPRGNCHLAVTGGQSSGRLRPTRPEADGTWRRNHQDFSGICHCSPALSPVTA